MAGRDMNKILIIDNDKAFCLFLKLNLERTGRFSVHVIMSGNKNFNFFDEVTPDLVLLDILLPEMSDQNFSSALLDEIMLREIPVLYLSSLIFDNEAERSHESPGDFFVSKTITSESLIAKIDSILERTSRG